MWCRPNDSVDGIISRNLLAISSSHYEPFSTSVRASLILDSGPSRQLPFPSESFPKFSWPRVATKSFLKQSFMIQAFRGPCSHRVSNFRAFHMVVHVKICPNIDGSAFPKHHVTMWNLRN